MALPDPTSPVAPRLEPADLGFGSRVGRDRSGRLLNRDGSFNVARLGLPPSRALNPYHLLLEISWPRFYALMAGLFLATNLVFAGLFLACGPGALHGIESEALPARALDAFFFSVQTLATIGYGRISPQGLPANLLVAAEALVGMLGFSVATGLTFARFSRPGAKIRFSAKAVVAPYRGGRALMFRIVNERTSQLVELDATVSLGWFETTDGRIVRRFVQLPLERRHVVFFPLHWVLVHPIDATSPLATAGPGWFEETNAEILVLVAGIDETSSSTVHARSSYRGDEIVVGARFRDVFLPPDGGRSRIDLRLFDDIDPVELPPAGRWPDPQPDLPRP